MSRRKKYKIKRPELNLSPETKRDIFSVVIFAIAFFSLFSIFNLTGSFGQIIDKFWQMVFGWGWWLWPFVLIIIGYLIINLKKYEIKPIRWLGLFLFILTFSGLLQLFAKDKTYEAAKLGQGGGLVGYIASTPLEKIASFWGALVILIALFLISLLLFFETSFNNILSRLHLPKINFLYQIKEKIKQKKQEKELKSYEAQEIGFEQKEIPNTETQERENNVEEPKDKEDVELEDVGSQKEMFPQTKRHYPKINIPLDLLNGKMSKPASGDIKANQEVIRKTLKHFGIEVEMGSVSIGPTVTQYTLKPAEGIKLSQITTLSNDLALALAAHPIRIEAPIPGKSLVGIEVPNQKVALVSLKEILSSEEFRNRESNLMIGLGKDVSGKPQLANLEKMPHLLIAGSTGSGKTVCLNSIIISLLYQNQPENLKLILIDPKRVELPLYNGIPYLTCPVITDVKKTVNALRWTVKEMDRRFQVLSEANKRNIASYNNSNPVEKMPYLILVIDELADLMAVAAPEVESAIIRLSQMARAVGIHLVVATQRPSVDIITGLIKANITSRIAFSVASITDSRTILDHAGAEKLLGRGDMLFITPELSKPKRIQGAYVSDNEIERLVKYLKQKGQPEYNEDVTKLPVSTEIDEYKEYGREDVLLPEAREIVIQAQKASASYLQRRLRIGYARAARLLDLLEKEGVVGPADGAKAREVLVKPTNEFTYDKEEDEEMENNKEDENESNQ